MMGEVGDSTPEKSAVEQIPTTAIARSEAPVNPLVQQNGDVLKITAQPPEEPMIVDSDDDSQNSCDNQSDIKATESTTANGDVETSQDGSNGRRHSKDDVDTKDSHAENCSDDDDDDDDEKTETEKSDGKKNGNSTENEESRDGGVSETQTSQDDGEEVDESQDDTSQSVTNDDDSQQSSHPPSKNGEDKSPPHVVEKLNGEAPKLIQDDDGVVDLDESDEEMPMADEAPKTNVEEKNPLKLPDAEENKEAKAPQRTISDSEGAVVIGSDSECEPEKELPPPAIPVPPPAAKSPQSQVQPQSHLQSQSNLQPQSQSLPQSQPQLPPVEKPRPPPLPPKPDDDDDDCVLIEDDSPSEASEAGSTVSGRQRKSLVKVRDFASFGDDQRLETDDSQPPSKRQRTSPNVVPSVVAGTQSPMAQITIKDARSLMPAGTVKSNVIASGGKEPTLVIIDTDTTKPSAPSLPPPGIFPVNIRPAMLSNQPQPQPQPQPQAQPAAPKAIPTMPVSTGVPALPTISNANLLPGLTDDMFVLEAPSFIVPYIYEKPPSDNLREIVNQIEMKFDLKKADNVYSEDDLDLGDDGKDANECAATTSKKKKKKRGSGDDSWSESDDSGDDDDDEDSESETRTKVLIKEASDDLKAIKAVIKPIQPTAPVVTSPSAPNANKQPNGENYFESPLGKFFMDIGAGQVQEFVQADLLRLQKRKMRRSLGKNITEIERAITALSGNLEASKKRNSAFKFNIKRCEFCNFKSESALAMAHHYETPHMNGVLYKCNFCTYEIRNSTEIVYHMEAMHNIKARLFKHLPYHQCPNCGFEDNGKAKLARHAPVCVKKFRPEVNLAPPHDWEAPAKIPRIKPRHGLVGTATAYQAMAAQAAAQKAALASIQQQQQQAQQARNIQAAMANNNVNKNLIRGRPQTVTKTTPNGGTVLRPGNPPVRAPMPTGMVPPNNYQIAAGQLIHVSGPGLAILPTSQNTLTLQTTNAAAATKKTPSGQPSISITPLPRQSSNTPQAQPSASGNKIPPTGMKPGQNPSGNKAQFVICEICDGYIKDLEQLRNHMQWMHKVKIHPKMIYNRPPLNCQKCQFRFFTDQGLERHLLGSHGLVTSSMQEAANKGKDAGRCPVCGRMYQWKLLNHVSRDHHMTLKPAHLSYKCTVCTATFGMYKQFETHVYTAHSTVAKKAMDGKKNNSGSSSMMNNSGGGGIMNTRHSLSAANDSLLKPLKINDEITIIPQPASKSRSSMNNIESHVID